MSQPIIIVVQLAQLFVLAHGPSPPIVIVGTIIYACVTCVNASSSPRDLCTFIKRKIHIYALR